MEILRQLSEKQRNYILYQSRRDALRERRTREAVYRQALAEKEQALAEKERLLQLLLKAGVKPE
jgi:hypothetical protein